MKKTNAAKSITTVLGAVLCTSLLSVAHAGTVTLSASADDRGAFNSTAAVSLLNTSWKVVTNSFQVRALGDSSVNHQVTRNYHLFDLPTLAADETITSAELRIIHPGNSYDSPDASETVKFYDVSTAGSILRSPDDTQPLSTLGAIFADLGGGVEFGTFDATSASNGTTESILLNSDALASITASLGGEWGIGGAIVGTTHTGFGTAERVLRGTGGANALDSELVLTTTVVPVPAAVWLFGSSFIGLAGFSRRRSNQPA